MLRISAIFILGWLAVSPAAAETAMITGANRGIGFEFAQQYAAKGWTVIATARDPSGAKELNALAAKNPKIKVEKLDVADPASIGALAAKYRGQPIDVLVNNAGAFGERKAQSFGSLDLAEFKDVMAVNVFGPLKVSEAFADNVASSGLKKIAVISSALGSIAQARASSAYYYGSSKAAVNYVMKVLAEQMRPRGVSVGIYMPGGVDTRMLREAVGMTQAEAEAAVDRGEAFPTGSFKPLSTEQSVTALMARIAELDQAKSGKFLNFDGAELPW